MGIVYVRRYYFGMGDRFSGCEGIRVLVRNVYLNVRFQVDHDSRVCHQPVACEKLLLRVDKAVKDLQGTVAMHNTSAL